MLALLLLAACTQEPDYPGLAPELFADQEGQDVIMTVQIFEGGDPGLDARYDLVQVGEEGDREVLARHAFDPDEADETGEACLEDPGALDTADPGVGSCDEVVDCSGDCVPWYGFDVVDPCQVAGQTAYELRLAAEEGFITSEHFYVVDMGDECESGGCSSLPARCGAGCWGALAALALAWQRRRRCAYNAARSTNDL